MRSRCVATAIMTGLFLLLATPVSTPAEAEGAFYWLPVEAGLEELRTQPDIFYEGLGGWLLGVEPEGRAEVEALGGRGFQLDASETLYVFLVEDAGLAAFESPSRVLLRSGREVLVATAGEAPRLTRESNQSLHGLKQPVRISFVPIPRASADDRPSLKSREADPLIQQMVNDLTTSNYMSTWQTLEDFVTRYTYTPQNEAATQWILDQFLSFGLDAEFHIYQQSGPKRNVIATLPGVSDPSRIVYITAHMDATSPTPETCAPGADDNGSGTAAVIEAARVLSNYQFEYTIKFACFNGEEQGLLGSEAYVADIYSLGEDVIGDYNMDMIAYRGTDPAPPDLVMYTDSASQSLAANLENAALTYTPGDLEPIILVESLGASDHASFWNYGYKAIVAIEEEAWGPDFCPWYHTCDDLIYRYPQDYVVNCAKANLAAVATEAGAITPDGPFLVMGDTTVDDDTNGGSNGDGDGAVNPGETIELWVDIRNVGVEAAINVTGELSSGSGEVTLITTSSAWNDIPPDGVETNLTPFVFQVSGNTVDGDLLPFTLTMTDDSGSRPLNFNLFVAAPDLAYYFHRLDDATVGNNNGVLDPGETLLIPASLKNSGAKDALDVEAVLTSTDPNLTVLDDEAGAGIIASGEVGDLSPAYRVKVSSGASDGDVFSLDLAITAGTGYQAVSGFDVRVGAHFYDEAEADGAWSLSAPGDDASTGVWVRVDPIGTSGDGGQPSQPEDDHTAPPGTDCYVTGQGTPGGSIGENDVDGGTTTLLSPSFDISNVDDPRVTYWRWYRNDLGNAPNSDNWVVQVSSNGGTTWTDLERTTESTGAWVERSFLIADYVTPSNDVVFRFVASDLGDGSIVEAGVDDFLISGNTTPVSDVGDVDEPLVLSLHPARPSPLSGSTLISFALPSPGTITLKLYGVNGRLVRTLAEGRAEAGVHRVPWDGTNDSGRPVAPGIYYYRLRAGSEVLTRSLVVVE